MRTVLLSVVLLAGGVRAADTPTSFKVIAADRIDYQPDAHLRGVSVAVLNGDPARGAYTMRVRFAPGTKVPAHMHPDERTVTVLSGTYRFGLGDRFANEALQDYTTGTVIVVPANTAHFSAAGAEGAIVQESGVGPTGATVVVPK
jgi:quercetin dioxygenase-like cupin family protein